MEGKELVWAVGEGTGMVEDTECEDEDCLLALGDRITLGTRCGA